MSKLLYTNGCSWTFGDGVSEHPGFPRTHNATIDYENMKNYAWPSVLANKLGYEVVNDSIAGGSNVRIVRTTVDFIMNYPKENYQDLVIIIGWTTVERDEIYIDHDTMPGWIRFNAGHEFTNKEQFSDKRFTKDDLKTLDEYRRIYMTYMYNHRINLKKYIQQKFILSNLLENLGIKYIFFDALPPEWISNDEAQSPEMANYFEELKLIKTPYYLEQSFLNFCKDNNIILSSCLHPMIDGHILWAEYMYNELNTLYPNL
jgi:hypothetical protein